LIELKLIMLINIEETQADIKHLPLAERWHLVKPLIAKLDSEGEYENAWEAITDRREVDWGSERLDIQINNCFCVSELMDYPKALILQKPLQQATQADMLTLQTSIAPPQPTQLLRISLVVQALPLDELNDTPRTLQPRAKLPATSRSARPGLWATNSC
jgi:hypothetical protein